MKISEDRLAELMARAQSDKQAEPAFFRALLEAQVYAHAPRHDYSGRLRLVQFALPAGQKVLPFFSERAQAEAASGPTVRIVALTGRQLMRLTRGATLMLNPNATSCLLYPEEIAALLDRGEVAVVEKLDVPDTSWQATAPAAMPAWLVTPLTDLYARLPCVEAAYLAQIVFPNLPGKPGWLIIIVVAQADAERAARATTTALQPHCKGQDTSLDLNTIKPGAKPDWLAELNIEPFYLKSWGERLCIASGNRNPEADA